MLKSQLETTFIFTDCAGLRSCDRGFLSHDISDSRFRRKQFENQHFVFSAADGNQPGPTEDHQLLLRFSLQCSDFLRFFRSLNVSLWLCQHHVRLRGALQRVMTNQLWTSNSVKFFRNETSAGTSADWF